MLVSLMCWTDSLNTVSMSDVLDGTTNTFLIGYLRWPHKRRNGQFVFVVTGHRSVF